MTGPLGGVGQSAAMFDKFRNNLTRNQLVDDLVAFDYRDDRGGPSYVDCGDELGEVTEDSWLDLTSGAASGRYPQDIADEVAARRDAAKS